MTEKIELTDANGNPEDVLDGAPAPTAREDMQDAPETPVDEPETPDNAPEAPEGADEAETSSEDDPATFPRSYVEKLRRENAGYRERAQQADELSQRLHTTLVESTGRLADATDLPFDDGHLDSPEALDAALDDLLARKPHLANRKPRGDVGQGVLSGGGDTVDLAGILRSRAS